MWPGARWPCSATWSKTGTEIGPDTKDAFSNCLLCRACTENCFSAVKTDKVVISFRHAYADRFGRGLLQRGVFRFLLPRPWLMRGLVKIVWGLRRTGLPDLARRAGLIGMLNPKLERALELREGTPGPLLTSRLKRRRRETRRPRARRQTAPAAAPSWVTGCPAATTTCYPKWARPPCGCSSVWATAWRSSTTAVAAWPPTATATWKAAASLARENLRRLGDLDRFSAIVSECGSCSGHLKEYAELLAEDPAAAAQAEALAEKVRSFSEFVQERGGLPAKTGRAAAVPRANAARGRPAAPIVITYHEPCHLGKRYQNVSAQPRQILRSLDGYEFREAAESDSCCGAAGTYGVLHPEASAAIIDRKTGFIAGHGRHRRGHGVPLVHDATRLRSEAGRQ